MAQNCGFFNAQYQDGEYDRVYNAEQFAAYFASFIGTGIFGDQMDELVPLARTESNMSVDISTGRAWINGWWYENDEVLNLPIALADGVLNRKDIIVLRWGNSERDMWLQVIQGEPSAEPVAPTIRRDADYFDLQLCEVSIPAGTTRITQALITDTRLDNTVCGFVFALVNQIDTTALYLQFNAQFNEWFTAVQEQFEGDIPATLQAQIDDLFSIISSKIESSSTSTHAYVVGDLFIYDNKLCKASSAISIGDTIILSPTTNYNCEQTSIVDEIPLGGGGSSNEYWYNTWADAEADIANIEEGGKVYTNDDPDDVINARNVKYDDGTQAGSDVETQINNIKSDLTNVIEEKIYDGNTERGIIRRSGNVVSIKMGYKSGFPFTISNSKLHPDGYVNGTVIQTNGSGGYTGIANISIASNGTVSIGASTGSGGYYIGSITYIV